MTSSLSSGTLTVQLPERIDTSVAPQVQQQLEALCQANPHEALVLDADPMAYISSSGLRILLSLAKQEKALRLINVCPEVYDIFQMTGFDRIIHLERKMRSIVIDGCPVIGRGAVGTVYRLTEDTIIKVFREGTPLSDVQHEINLAREAFVFGLPTAISFELVRVGSCYGIIHELINARTLASVIAEDPTRAEEYGARIGRLMHDIHQIKDTEHRLPDAVEVMHAGFERLKRYFSEEEVAVLREIYDAIPQGQSVLHCDLHPKNVMLSGGELILIDMGEVCFGNPLQDMAHTYSAMKAMVGDYKAVIGIDQSTAGRCFDSLLRAYLQTDDPTLIARRMEQLRIACLPRNFAWLNLSDSFPEASIQQCREVFHQRIDGQMDYIRTILPQFREWE